MKSVDIGNGSFYPTTDDYIEYLHEWGNFHIENCNLLESISIGYRCFQFVKSLKIDGLSRLKTVKIGDSSFTGYYGYFDNFYDKNMSGEFEITNCESLESIEIGNDCFESVQAFKIDGLNRLKTIKIGNNSFTHEKNSSGNDESKSFHIMNCESLESIQIGRHSFSDFAGEFELKNLPQLQSIQIGTIGWESLNFYNSSFVIRGIELILNN